MSDIDSRQSWAENLAGGVGMPGPGLGLTFILNFLINMSM